MIYVPSRSASRVLAPMTVTVAAWMDEEARVRAAVASWRSWRGKKTDWVAGLPGAPSGGEWGGSHVDLTGTLPMDDPTQQEHVTCFIPPR